MSKITITDFFTKKEFVYHSHLPAKAVYRIIKSNFRNAPRKENTRRKRQLSVQLDRKFQNIILEKNTFLSIFRCKWYSIVIQD